MSHMMSTSFGIFHSWTSVTMDWIPYKMAFRHGMMIKLNF